MELLREPLVILDGAINAESARYLAELLVQAGKPLYMVLGVPADKDWRGVIDTLAPLAESVWLTRASNNHLVFPEDAEALAVARRHTANSRVAADMATALEEAGAAAGSNGAVVIAGTQSLIRDAKIEIKAQLGREWDE